MKDKNESLISINAEYAFDKIQHLFMTKVVNKRDMERMYVNKAKSHLTNRQVSFVHQRCFANSAWKVWTKHRKQ